MHVGSNCRLGVCCRQLTDFWFHVYFSLESRVYYHWQICLLIWLLSSFLFLHIDFFFSFSLLVSVCVCFFFDFCLYSFAFIIYPRVLSVWGVFLFVFFFFLSTVSSTCYHLWICFLVWLLSSFFFLFFITF